MPLSLVVRDRNPGIPEGWYEALANGRGGAPLGRELELARLLSFVRRRGVRNVVWIAADVHYACAIQYDPSRAAFRDFAPFWEFVAGPLHAGTFGLGELDPSFGPELRFASVPRDLAPNRPPSEGLQFFGLAEIDGASEDLHGVDPRSRGDAALRGPAPAGALSASEAGPERNGPEGFGRVRGFGWVGRCTRLPPPRRGGALGRSGDRRCSRRGRAPAPVAAVRPAGRPGSRSDPADRDVASPR